MHRLFRPSEPMTVMDPLLARWIIRPRCQPREWQRAWKTERWRGGNATWHVVPALTWFASGRRRCQICVWPIWMLPWGAKLLQEPRKPSLRHVCLQSNLILFQQTKRSMIAWEGSCQVALKSAGPLTLHVDGERRPITITAGKKQAPDGANHERLFRSY